MTAGDAAVNRGSVHILVQDPQVNLGAKHFGETPCDKRGEEVPLNKLRG